jgi:hypothetical protein
LVEHAQHYELTAPSLVEEDDVRSIEGRPKSGREGFAVASGAGIGAKPSEDRVQASVVA